MEPGLISKKCLKSKIPVVEMMALLLCTGLSMWIESMNLTSCFPYIEFSELLGSSFFQPFQSSYLFGLPASYLACLPSLAYFLLLESFFPLGK